MWSVKYRRNVLDQEIEAYLKELFQEIAEEKGFEVVVMEVEEQDHVHVFASAHPKIAPSYIVKMLKGISARKLFLKFPRLKNKLWEGHLWNSSFYIETIGSISEETIRKYIENQKKKGWKNQMMKSYKFKLEPNKVQMEQIETTLNLCRWLYNIALEQRKFSYEKRGISVNYNMQQNELPQLKKLIHFVNYKATFKTKIPPV